MTRIVPLLVAVAALIVSGIAVAQNSGAPLKVEISSTFQGALRAGASGEVTLTLTNLLPVREVVMRAQVTYMIGNQPAMAVSNELRFTIDDSITVTQLRLALSNLTDISVRDAGGRSVNFAVNGGEVILNNIVVGQQQPVVLTVTGNVAVAPATQ